MIVWHFLCIIDAKNTKFVINMEKEEYIGITSNNFFEALSAICLGLFLGISVGYIFFAR